MFGKKKEKEKTQLEEENTQLSNKVLMYERSLKKKEKIWAVKIHWMEKNYFQSFSRHPFLTKAQATKVLNAIACQMDNPKAAVVNTGEILVRKEFVKRVTLEHYIANGD